MRNCSFWIKCVFVFSSLLFFLEVSGQSSVYRYGNTSWGIKRVLNFNSDPVRAEETTHDFLDSRAWILSSFADSNGKLKYLFCGAGLDSKYGGGGIYDTLGNVYYQYSGRERFNHGINLSSTQLLLPGVDTLLIVNKNNLNQVIGLYRRRIPPFIYNFGVRKWKDTCYLSNFLHDSLYLLKAAHNYVGPVTAISVNHVFEHVKYQSKIYGSLIHASVDFNHDMKKVCMVLNMKRNDSTESVLALADFDKKRLKISNIQILLRGFRADFFSKVLRNEPLVSQALFAPDDSSIYFTEQHYWLDEEGEAAYDDHEKVKRLHLYPNREVLIEGFDSENNYQSARLYRAANNKLYYLLFQDLTNRWKTMEISYPDLKDDEIEVNERAFFVSDHGRHSSELNYYEPFVEAQLVRRCPQPVFTTHHYQQPDSVRWHLYTHGDSQLVATGSGMRFSPQVPKTGTYILCITHYRQGFAQYLWQKYDLEAPLQAALEVQDALSCTFKPLSLRNTSTYDSEQQQAIQWKWTLNQKGTNTTYSGFEPSIKPTTKGRHKLNLIASNEHCTDTSASALVEVQNANPPGFSLSREIGCLYHKWELKTDSIGPLLDSTHFAWNGRIVSRGNQVSYQARRAGVHVITQTMYSKGGCSTSATDTVRILHGFDDKDSAHIHFVSVSNDSIHIQVPELPHGSHRLLYRDGQLIDSFAASHNSYFDTKINSNQVYTYIIENIDSCATARNTELHNNIVLTTINANNTLLINRWNKYTGWLGKNFYRVEYSTDKKAWFTLGEVSNLNFSVNSKLLHTQDSAQLRIVVGNTQVPYKSISNTVKIDLRNTLFIPNAFSPNGDGLNDTFAIGFFGFRSFECRVFARNGQIVSYSNEPSNIWAGKAADGLPYPIGDYTYSIKAIDGEGNSFNYTGTVHLIK